MTAQQPAVYSMTDVVSLLNKLAAMETFDSRRVVNKQQAIRWLNGERAAWLISLKLRPGPGFLQRLVDALAAESTKLMLQHPTPRRVTADWWSCHMEPLCWFIELLARETPGASKPHLSVATTRSFR